ncbi:MAG: hypothetical protein RL511_520 [Bacteroidota bacterium]|jgi:hypothetical protein
MQFANEHPDLRRKYEELVASQDRIGFFDQIWVQDTLHPKWQYLVNKRQDPILRIPVTKKIGVRAFLQPLFLRSLPVFTSLSSEELDSLKAQWFLHLNLDSPQFKEESKNTGQYQLLQWTEGIAAIRAGYSENMKRNLKKSIGLHLHPINYHQFQEFFIAQKGENIGNLNAAAWMRLAHLFATAQEKEQAMSMGVFSGADLLAVGLFFRFKEQLYFMKGTLNAQGKEKGALVFLIDAVLERFASECTSLDFVGSNQESIAVFYRKFGAEDHVYGIVKGRIPLF